MMESLKRFITMKPKLKVKEQKSPISRPWARKFLGFINSGSGTEATDRAERDAPMDSAVRQISAGSNEMKA